MINFYIILLWKVKLTCNPAKKQPLAQIRKFNFQKLFALVSMSWYQKYIDIWLALIWAPLWGPGYPKVPKKGK